MGRAVLSFVRRRAPGRGWRYFAILLAAALATEWGAIALSKWAADRDNAQERIAKTEMSKAFSTVINPDSGAIDMRIKAQGDAGEMERLSKFGAAKTLASARKYRETLAALDFPAFVGPARLAADPGLVQTREKLRQARAAVQTYRTEIGANIADIQAEIRKSQMSEAHKTEFATGFAESSAKSHKNAERTLDCEDGILAEFDAIADLLSRAKGRWSVKGKTIEFTNAQDLASYQAHISKIRQFSQEESEFVATQKSSMTSAQNEFMHGD